MEEYSHKSKVKTRHGKNLLITPVEHISVNDVETYSKELEALKEKLNHLKVSVFEDNQSVCIDRFDFLGLIGIGGYSKAYKVQDKTSKVLYAIKLVRKILALHRRCIECLKNEVEILLSFHSE